MRSCNIYANGNFALILLFIVFFSSCGKSDKNQIKDNRSKLSSISRQKLMNAKSFNELFDKRREIRLEAGEHSMLGLIKQIIEINGKIFVLDDRIAQGVYVFSQSGKYIQKIGRNGHGPGEYNSPKFIGIDPDQHIVILNDIPCKLIYYDQNGIFLKDLNLDSKGIIAERFLIDARGFYYFYTLNSQFTRVSKGRKVVVADRDVKVLYTMGSPEPYLRKLFISGGAVQIDPYENIWIGKVFDFEIEIYDKYGHHLKTISAHDAHLPSLISSEVFANIGNDPREQIKELQLHTSIADIFFLGDSLAILVSTGLEKYNLTFFDLDGNLVKDKIVIDPRNPEGLKGPIIGSKGDEIYTIEEGGQSLLGRPTNPKIIVYGLQSSSNKNQN